MSSTLNIFDAIQEDKDPTREYRTTTLDNRIITPRHADVILSNCRYEKQRTVKDKGTSTFNYQEQADGFIDGTVIKISREGTVMKLVDGQHRLENARRTNTSFVATIIIYDVSKSKSTDRLYQVIDEGLRRSIQDQMRASDLAGKGLSPTQLAIARAAVISLMHRNFTNAGRKINATIPANAAIRLWWNEIRDYFMIIEGSPIRAIMQRQSIMSFALATLRIDRSNAIRFWSKVSCGSELLSEPESNEGRLCAFIESYAARHKPKDGSYVSYLACAWNYNVMNMYLPLKGSAEVRILPDNEDPGSFADRNWNEALAATRKFNKDLTV